MTPSYISAISKIELSTIVFFKKEDMQSPKNPNSFFNKNTQGTIFALLATIVWSGNFIVSREMVGALPPVTLAFLRWVAAVGFLLPFGIKAIHKDWAHLCQHWRYYLIASVIGISIFNTLYYIAAHYVSALNLSLIAITAPVFTLILSRIIWGEAISYKRAFGLLIVLGGILLLVARGDMQVLLSLSFAWADLLALGGALSFAIYTLLLRSRPQGASQLTFLLTTFGLGMLCLIPFVVWELASGAEVHLSTKVWLLILYIGLGPSLFSFWCWGMAIERIGASKASIIYYTLPLFCGVEAVIFLNEPILWVHYASGALILGGLYFATNTVKK